MTLTELISKYNGKPCKIFPNNLSPQCFELVCAWTDGLGVPHVAGNPSPFPYENAYQIYTDFGSYQAQYFDRIANSPTGMPQAGDLVVWGSSYNGGAGHVAVATGANTDTNHFQALEQNDPNPYCQLKDYNYNSVLGWLRPKVQGSTPTPTPVDTCPAQLTAITAERDRLNGVITGKDDTITHLGATIDQKNSELATLQATVASQTAILLTKDQSIVTLTEQALKVQPLTDQLAQAEQSKKLYAEQVSALQTQLGTIKSKLVPKKTLSLKLYNFLMSLE